MDRRKTDRRNSPATDMLVLDLQDMFKTLWRQKFLIGIFMLLIMLPCAVYVWLKPDVYKSTATLILENEKINLAGFEDAIPVEKLESADIDTQVKILKSPSLARQTIVSFTKKDATHKQLRNFLSSLSVSAEGKSRVISLSYTAKDPYSAAAIANGHAQEFIKAQIQNRREKVSAISQWMEGQIAHLKEESRKKSQATRNFKKESGIVQGKNSQDSIEQQIIDFTTQLARIEARKLSLQAKAQVNEQEQEKPFDDLKSEIIADLKMELSKTKQELGSLKSKYGLQHPEYIAAHNRYSQINNDLIYETANAKTFEKNEIEATIQEELMLRTRLEELNAQADGLREKQIALNSLEAEESATLALLENLLERSEEIRTQVSLNRSDIRLDSKAEIPMAAEGIPKIILFFLLAAFALIGAALITLMLELTVNILKKCPRS